MSLLILNILLMLLGPALVVGGLTGLAAAAGPIPVRRPARLPMARPGWAVS